MSYGELKGFRDHFGYGGVAPGLCSGLKAIPEANLGRVCLKWTDPVDTVIEGKLISSWKKTTVVRKTGSFPTNISDGKKIVEITERNKYQTAEFEDTDLEGVDNLEDLCYMAFPESDTGAVSINEANRFVMGARYIHYAFRWDLSNSDPAGAITYLEEAVGKTPAHMDYTGGVFDYGDWENAFFMPRPCMLKYDGTVDYYLNPDNYAQKEDGSASDVANTSYGGNAMIEFPTVWIYIDTSVANKPVVHISDQQIDSNYKAWAHHDKNGQIMPFTYMPAYNGSLISNKLRSLSGQGCMNSQTGASEITYAKANGENWYTELFVDRLLVQMLLLLIGKSANTQAVFGNGHYTGGSQASHLLQTGTMNTRGLFWGTNDTGSGVKVFGMENFWGNEWRRIGGLINANGTQKYKLTYGTEDGSTVTGWNTDGNGYKVLSGGTPGGTSGGYISGCKATPDGVFPVTASGSETTFLCDGLWFNNSQSKYAFVGGACDHGFLCGAFAVNVNDAVSVSYWNVGASLSCKPTV